MVISFVSKSIQYKMIMTSARMKTRNRDRSLTTLNKDSYEKLQSPLAAEASESLVIEIIGFLL
jgi:hypothetical protein